MRLQFRNVPKWMMFFLMFSLVGCSAKGPGSMDAYATGAELKRSNPAFYDHNLSPLEYEYKKADSAISINDAEKVNLQRLEEDLLNEENVNCKLD